MQYDTHVVFVRAGLPAGVLNIVHGYGQGVGDPIVRHKDVHAVSFTGGTSTGALVATAAAPSFKKVLAVCYSVAASLKVAY